MRLTLRTLLAYLDDALDPAQTRQIGQKVAESQAVQDLIARIKDVVRRRRLTTPPLTGADAKIDANMVGEYIDNILSPEMIAKVEEVCLESDVHLAEVASCHQLQSVIKSEPALVPPTAKRRMYSLLKGRESIPNRPVPAAVGGEAGRAHTDEEADETLLGLSVLMRPGSPFRRAAPFVGGLLLVSGLVAAIWFSLPPRLKQTSSEIQLVDLGKKDPAEKAEPAAKVETPVEAKAVPKVEVKPDSPKPEPAKPEPAKPEPKVEPPPGPKPAPERVEPPSGVRRELGKHFITAPNGLSVLLHRVKDVWQPIGHNAPIFSSEQLLSLPGFRSELKLASGVQLSLWGNMPDATTRGFALESSVLLNDDPACDADVRLDRGRIAVQNLKPSGPAKVRIRFLKEIWEVTLLQPGSRLVMELWSAYRPGVPFTKESGGEEPMTFAGLFMVGGQASLKIRYNTFLMSEPPGKNLFLWDNTGEARAPQALPDESVPSWAHKSPPIAPAELRQALNLLQQQLAKAGLDDVLSQALRSKEKQTLVRVVAVFSLAAIDDLSRLIDALGDSDFRDERLAAISALRHWCGIQPDNDLKVYRALESKYRANQAEIIMSLLHTFGERERGDPLTYETLIAYLNHDKIAIRELAFSHLASLVPEGVAKIAYDPGAPAAARDHAGKRWKELIPDGKLPPAPKPGPGRN